MTYLDKRDYEEQYGEIVGRCNVHRVQVVDRSCSQCEDEWICSECQEVRMYDPFIEEGKMCMVCTYENKGGE